MSNFTEGEWKVNKHYGCIYSGETLIARVANFSENASTPETEANARLIAAAPELYEMLREELIPISDYGGLLSLSRADKVHKLLARIDGEDEQS